MATGLRAAESTLEAARASSPGADLTAQELLAEAAQRIERVVPTDGYFLSATDPETTLAHRAPASSGTSRSRCAGRTWDYEFLVPDYLKFADIAQSGRAVADLHDATGGGRSARRGGASSAAATGFRAEVRVAFTLGDATWGIGQLNRLGDSPRFSDEEKAWLERVAPRPRARAAHARSCAEPPRTPADRGPGLVLLDEDGSVVSVDREAAEWLDELDLRLTFTRRRTFACRSRPCLRRARPRCTHEVDPATDARARVRTRTGVWLTDARLAAGGHRPGGPDHRAGEGGRRRAADRRGLRAHARASSTSRA